MTYSRNVTEFNNRISKYIKNIHKDSKTVKLYYSTLFCIRYQIRFALLLRTDNNLVSAVKLSSMPYRLVNADRIGPVSHYNWKRPVTDTNMPSTGRVFCIQIRHSGNISLDGMVTVNADGSVQCQEVNYRQIASKL